MQNLPIPPSIHQENFKYIFCKQTLAKNGLRHCGVFQFSQNRSPDSHFGACSGLLGDPPSTHWSVWSYSFSWLLSPVSTTSAEDWKEECSIRKYPDNRKIGIIKQNLKGLQNRGQWFSRKWVCWWQGSGIQLLRLAKGEVLILSMKLAPAGSIVPRTLGQ